MFVGRISVIYSLSKLNHIRQHCRYQRSPMWAAHFASCMTTNIFRPSPPLVLFKNVAAIVKMAYEWRPEYSRQNTVFNCRGFLFVSFCPKAASEFIPPQNFHLYQLNSAEKVSQYKMPVRQVIYAMLCNISQAYRNSTDLLIYLLAVSNDQSHTG